MVYSFGGMVSQSVQRAAFQEFDSPSHCSVSGNGGKPNPAAIISRFSQEEEQREAASLFNTKLPYMQQDMESQSQLQEREKAFHISLD